MTPVLIFGALCTIALIFGLAVYARKEHLKAARRPELLRKALAVVKKAACEQVKNKRRIGTCYEFYADGYRVLHTILNKFHSVEIHSADGLLDELSMHYGMMHEPRFMPEPQMQDLREIFAIMHDKESELE